MTNSDSASMRPVSPWLSDATLDRLRLAMATPDLAGTRYRLVGPLGHGGMADVFLVEDAVLKRRVAMKVVPEAVAASRAADRLRQEAEVLARLEHPGIVPVYDAGTLADGRGFYVMKYVRGERLDRFVREGVSLLRLLEVFRRICETIAAAHAAGVVHRDLKPQNIMVGTFGEVLVMDWGVAKLLDEAGHSDARPSPCSGDADGIGNRSTPPKVGPPQASISLTREGSVLGTPGYMAPEQERGDLAQISPRTDVYALGAILSHLLGARAPGALRAVSHKAMALSPAERYPDAQTLADEIDRYLAREPVLALPETWIVRASRRARRYRTALLIVGAYVVMRLLLVLFLHR